MPRVLVLYRSFPVVLAIRHVFILGIFVEIVNLNHYITWGSPPCLNWPGGTVFPMKLRVTRQNATSALYSGLPLRGRLCGTGEGSLCGSIEVLRGHIKQPHRAFEMLFSYKVLSVYGRYYNYKGGKPLIEK